MAFRTAVIWALTPGIFEGECVDIGEICCLVLQGAKREALCLLGKSGVIWQHQTTSKHSGMQTEYYLSGNNKCLFLSFLIPFWFINSKNIIAKSPLHQQTFFNKSYQ